jgi:hypothetical protein
MDTEAKSALGVLKIQNDIYVLLRNFAHQLEQSSVENVVGPTFTWHNFEHPSVPGLKGAFQVDLAAGLVDDAKAWTSIISCYEDKWAIEGLLSILSAQTAQDWGEDNTEVRELAQYEAHSLSELAERANQAVTELTKPG